LLYTGFGSGITGCGIALSIVIDGAGQGDGSFFGFNAQLFAL
jgi:hypothetical protein